MQDRKYKPLFCLLFITLIVLSGCSSVWSKKYKDDASVMYGMIYDENEEGVPLVSVKVNGLLKAVSDGQERFILKFLYSDIKDEKEQKIGFEKESYEKLEKSFIMSRLAYCI